VCFSFKFKCKLSSVKTEESEPKVVTEILSYTTHIAVFTRKLDLNLRKKIVKCYILRIALCGAEKLDTSESRSETPGKF
jgi:hypothetical protein